MDVTKQRDLTGFYRHLYQQTTEDPPSQKEEFRKKSDRKHNLRQRQGESSDEDENEEQPTSNSGNQTTHGSSAEISEDQGNIVSEVKEIEEMEAATETDVKSDETVGKKKADLVQQNEPTDKSNEVIDKKALLMKKFAKRTVGDVFEAAKEKYLRRKEARNAFGIN